MPIHYNLFAPDIDPSVNGTNQTNISDFCDQKHNSDEDLLAGLALTAYGIIGELFYMLINISMYKLSLEANGFIFLLSQGVINVIAALLYTIIPGLIILFPELQPAQSSWWVGHIIMDSIWFIMVNHYTLVALSRFMAVFRPSWFRVVGWVNCYMYCAFCWLCGFILSLILHFMPFWVIFYYDPCVYGMRKKDDGDVWKYSTEGTAYVYMVYHVIMLSVPIICYTAVIIRLILHSRKLRGHKLPHLRHISSTVMMTELCRLRYSNNNRNNYSNNTIILNPNNNNNNCKDQCIIVSNSTESRILSPCIINTLFFIIGQILITTNPVHGRWGGWLIMFVFGTNALINSLLMFIFSSPVRDQFTNVCSTSCQATGDIDL